MHKIASHLTDYDCYFTQFYSDSSVVNRIIKTGWLDFTILSGQFKKSADEYLEAHHLKNDYAQSRFNNQYDLVFVCSDLILPKSIRGIKTVWVQEGMTDKLTFWSKLVRAVNLPPYLAAGTSLNGTSNECDIYCAASHGYRKHFARLGTDIGKIVVTGMPNFDNVDSFLENDFPHKDYVLIATSDIRECFGFDDRVAFIRKCVETAKGRPMIFKLHPNEKMDRAIREIRENTQPDTLIYTDGNINHMIANCDELITQYSTVAYIGLALHKKTHSYFDIEQLIARLPIQNGGVSAANIARVGREYMEFKGSKSEFLNTRLPLLNKEYRKMRLLGSAA